MLSEPKLIGAVSAEGTCQAIVRYQSFELPSEVVPLDPVRHVSAIARSEFDSAIRVHIAEVGDDVVPSKLEITVWVSSPLVLDGILQIHSPAA